MDYDDSEVDAGQASQQLDLTDLSFTFNGVVYDLTHVSPADVDFQYGELVGFSFSVAMPPMGGSQLSVTVGGGNMQVIDPESGTGNYDVEVHTYDSLVLDTSESVTGATFLVTLSDGTLLQGDFAMDSGDVVSNGSAAVTDFTLTVGSTTFTEADTVSTPLAHFVNGVFVGLSFDIQNITGQSFDRIVSANGVVTPYLNAVAQQPKRPIWQTRTAVLDFDTIGTGLAYGIQMKVYTDGGGNPILTATITVSVAETDTVSQIRDKVLAALKQAGIFAFAEGDSRIVIGGNEKRANNEPPRALRSLDITLFTSTNQNGFPEPDFEIPGLTYERKGGIAPIVKLNGHVILPRQ